MDIFLALARLGYRGNTGGGQPPPPMVPSVIHAGSVAVPERVAQAHRAVHVVFRAEAMAAGGGGENGGNFKGFQSLWAPI